MKKSNILLFGMITFSLLSMSLVSATITINSPSNRTIFDYYSMIPIDFTSDYGDIHVFVSHNTSFSDNNVICNYSVSGTYECNFTAVYTGAYESDCESIYKFGDDGIGVEIDSGSGGDDCSVLGTVDTFENCGLRKNCAEFTTAGDRLSCSTSHSDIVYYTDDFTLMAWVFLPTALGGLETGVQNYVFEKGDQRPSFKLYGASDSLGYTSSYSGAVSSINDNPRQYVYDIWQHQVLQHDEGLNKGFLFYNDVSSGGGAMNPTFVGSAEYIGGGHSSQYFKGYLDEFKICNRLFSETELAEMYVYKDGTYYFKINNSNGDEVYGWFIKDLTVPVINLIQPKYESSSGHIELTITDLTNITANITLDGIQIDYLESNASQYYINQTSLSLGEHNLTILSTDEAGRITIKEKIFDVMTIQKIKLFDDDKNFTFKFFIDTKNAIIRFFGGSV